jgi:V/A-type H+-transporting ATPase subunit A
LSTIEIVYDLLLTELTLKDKGEARHLFNRLRQRFLDYNGSEWKSDTFNKLEKEIKDLIAGHRVTDADLVKTR